MRLPPISIILAAGLLLSFACSNAPTVDPAPTATAVAPPTATALPVQTPDVPEARKEAASHHLTPHLFEAADGTPIAGEWGRLLVPENRANPASNRLEIPFVRFKTSVPDPGTPTVFLNGGPGEETLAIVPQFLPFVPELPFDLILVEQRGIGHSRPRLDCPGTYHLPLDQPLDFETMLAAASAFTEGCARSWEEQGVDLAGYNVREMAADIDALRQALGYDQINLLGGSFGSHHGLAVLRFFGEHVDRGVLSAVEGPNHTIKLPSTIQGHLEELDRMVRADSELSRDIPDFLELMATVLDRLEQEPATVEITNPESGEQVAVTVGKLDLQLVTANGLGRTDFLRALPSRYYAMSQGDFSWLAEEVLSHRTGRSGSLMSALVDCASGATMARRAQIQQETQGTLLGNAINGVQFELCDSLEYSDLGDQFRADLQTQVPVLLVSGSLDARTPVSNAEEVLKGLAEGQHLILEGVSHDFALGDELFLQFIQTQSQFLMGGPLATERIIAPFQFDSVANGGF
ncbi:MAG: alpha/beta fold hydrolase [Dehalococcoidia bacterium]